METILITAGTDFLASNLCKIERDVRRNKDSSISIIIPVYNAEKYLRECLDSILIQSFPDIEVLCVDDGSTDASLAILCEYEQKDERFKIFTQNNSGPAVARNVGLCHASGEYIMFCDADDMYEPSMCELMVHTLKETNVDFVMCDANILVTDENHGRSQGDINYHRLHFQGEVHLTAALKKEINVLLWNKIFRREIIQKYHITFPEGYEYDDSIFFMQYVSASETAFGLNKKLYDYRLLNSSIMGRILAQKRYEKFFNKPYALSFVASFLNKNNLMGGNLWFIDTIGSEISNFFSYFDREQKKKFLKLITEKVISQIDPNILSRDPERYEELLLCLKGNYDQVLQRRAQHRWWGKVKNSQKEVYYCFGLPIHKKKKREDKVKYYLCGIPYWKKIIVQNTSDFS
jgi:glycosyltransferase involved in cell wall biosynthesis